MSEIEKKYLTALSKMREIEQIPIQDRTEDQNLQYRWAGITIDVFRDYVDEIIEFRTSAMLNILAADEDTKID